MIAKYPQETHLLRKDSWFDWLNWTQIKDIYAWMVADNENRFPKPEWRKDILIRSYLEASTPTLKQKSHNNIDYLCPDTEASLLLKEWSKHCAKEIHDQKTPTLFGLGTLYLRKKPARKHYNHFGAKQIQNLPARQTIALQTRRGLELNSDSTQTVSEKNPQLSLFYWKGSKSENLSPRRQLARDIAKKTGIPVEKSVYVINESLQNLLQSVRHGKTFCLPYFGSFKKELRVFGTHKREKIVFKPLAAFETLCGIGGETNEQ